MRCIVFSIVVLIALKALEHSDTVEYLRKGNVVQKHKCFWMKKEEN